LGLVPSTSALPPKADIDHDNGNVRFVPKADTGDGERMIDTRANAQALSVLGLTGNKVAALPTARRTERQVKSRALTVSRVSYAFLGLGITCSLGFGRQLKNRSTLILHQRCQKHDLPVRKLQRIVMRH
jgi:hypothetical protein